MQNNPVNWIDPLGLFGFGTFASGTAEGGIVAAGGGATGAYGAGVFWGGPQGAIPGSFASFGGFLGGHGYGPSYPSGNSGNIVGGGYIGGGGGLFVTNAKCANQLEGPFNTYSLNLGVGLKISFQLGISAGTWIFSVNYGWGIGISGSSYQTNTWAIK